MTTGEIIAEVDRLEPNQYDGEQKLRWLSIFDGKIFHELIETHEGAERDSFEPHTELEAVLLIPFPWGREVYTHYLQAMIAEGNGEGLKYNQQITLCNAAYQSYADWYNRTHRAIVSRYGNRFRF